MKKEIRTALIGTGSMGKKYAKMIADGEVVGMKLSAMVCRSESSFEWGKTFADAKIYRSVEELYSNGNDFDAVIIATPHKTHPELALGAFEIGKHVMCDKPAGIYAKDAVRMYKAAEEKKLVYGLMFHQRLRSDYIKVKEMIKKGEFGAIHRIMMVCTRYFRTNAYHKSSPWRSSIEGEGGGALINQGQHILDMWQWLFGLPKEIQALVMTGKYNDFDVEDEASIFMRYENNTTGSFIISTAEGMSEDRLVISGSKKSAVLSDGILKVIEFSEDTDDYRKKAKCNAKEDLEIKSEIIEFPKVSDHKLYIDMLKNFTDAINYGEKLIAPGREGVGALLLTNGAYISEKKMCRIELEEIIE